jgi:hypothetical protein
MVTKKGSFQADQNSRIEDRGRKVENRGLKIEEGRKPALSILDPQSSIFDSDRRGCHEANRGNVDAGGGSGRNGRDGRLCDDGLES